ncbi:hypothetical protein OC701_02450, partial ['Bonamia sp.' little leaf phytoplasma]|nr:hypothetical protein ['Bonamia sp.' little leaf phytoplasma]
LQDFYIFLIYENLFLKKCEKNMFSFIFLIIFVISWYYFIIILPIKIIGFFIGFVCSILISWLINFLFKIEKFYNIILLITFSI